MRRSVVALTVMAVIVAGWFAAAVGADAPSRSLALADDDRTQATISVSGEGRVLVQPDTASATLGVQIQDEELSAALTEANTTMNDVIAAIQDLGIDERDIETVVFSVDVIRDFDQPDQPITGYTVTNLVQATTDDIEQVADIVDEATSAGANIVRSVTFAAEDIQDAVRQAREEAMMDARDTAEHLAELADVPLGSPVSISESSAPSPAPVEQRDAVATGGSTPIEPGQQEVVVTVSVAYAIGGQTTGDRREDDDQNQNDEDESRATREAMATEESGARTPNEAFANLCSQGLCGLEQLADCVPLGSEIESIQPVFDVDAGTATVGATVEFTTPDGESETIEVVWTFEQDDDGLWRIASVPECVE